MENLKKEDIYDLLSTAIFRGIIDISDVQRKIEMTKRQEYLNLHKEKYEVWQGTNGNWYTYLYDESKKNNRRLVKKSTLTKLEKEIVDYYKALETTANSKKVCLKDFYPEWLEYKQLHTNSSAYIRRIDDDWNRYYKDTPIIHIPLVNLDFLTLDEWAHKIIKKYHLTKRQYYNMSMILRQSLSLAKQKKLVDSNVFNEVHIDSKLFKSTKKADDKKQVFLVNEQPLVEAEAYRDFEENCHKSSAPLAIPLLFQLGCRLGELVALKTTDIKDNYIHIQRQEVKEERRNENGEWLPACKVVVEYTKSEAGDRWVYLSSKAKEIIKKILANNQEQGFRDEDYIFLDTKGRIHERAVDTRIRKYCNHLGLEYVKSSHDARRTYISALIDKNININEVRKLVGHADERTTYKNYCYNRMTDEQTEHALESALCS